MTTRVRTCGETALLVDLTDLDEVLQLNQLVADLRRERPWDTLVDVVPAARTLLLATGNPSELALVRDALNRLLTAQDFARQVLPDQPRQTPGEEHHIPVGYDGPDLDEVARLTGLTTAEVIAAHTGTPWRVAFCGFAPGFPYLVGGDPRLEVPRLAQPRTSVPAGSVGLAGRFSGIYPRSSPGGWQLLGTTDIPLWDVHRDPPALLQPGMVVRFVER